MTSSPSAISTIANSGVLHEIPNFEGAVARYIKGEGKAGSGTTVKPVLFALYPTGLHGPQNGFRVILVETGADPETVEKEVYALGEISLETKDFVQFSNGKATVV